MQPLPRAAVPPREQFNIISNAPLIGNESAPVAPAGGNTTRPVNPIQIDAPALPYRRVSQQIGQVPPSNPTIEAMKRGELSLLYPIENHSVHQPWSPTAEPSAAPRKLTSSQCRALRAQVPTGDEWGQITALQVILAEEEIQKQVEEKKRARLQTKEEVLAQIEVNKRKQAELLIQKKGTGAETDAMRELERKWTEEASKLQEEIAFKNMTYKQQLDYDARKKREAVERVKHMFSTLSLFESVYLEMHWSDSNHHKRTMVLQTVLVMYIFSSPVPHTRSCLDHLGRTTGNKTKSHAISNTNWNSLHVIANVNGPKNLSFKVRLTHSRRPPNMRWPSRPNKKKGNARLTSRSWKKWYATQTQLSISTAVLPVF